MNTKKIEWLASLRGLLVLLFFVSHLPLLVDFSPNLAFIIGRIGVVGFFLIAGYLVVSSISRI
jgi:peptidoglycan/LPS O-acetylase OafA/YrhL